MALIQKLKPLIVPRDEKDSKFCKSFSVKEKKEILQFFDEFGFVIINNVLSPKEIQDSIDEIWNILQFKDPSTKTQFEHLKVFCELNDKKLEIVNKDKPSTWNVECGWPYQGKKKIVPKILGKF